MHERTVSLFVVVVLLVASSGIAALGAAVAGGADLGQDDAGIHDGESDASEVVPSDVGSTVRDVGDGIVTALHDLRNSLLPEGAMENAVHDLAALGDWIRGAA